MDITDTKEILVGVGANGVQTGGQNLIVLDYHSSVCSPSLGSSLSSFFSSLFSSVASGESASGFSSAESLDAVVSSSLGTKQI